MKKWFKVPGIFASGLVFSLLLFGCENPTSENNGKSVSNELIGKWEWQKLLANGTEYSLPVQNINTGGYEFSSNKFTSYANGSVAFSISAYSEGNTIYSSDGRAGYTWKITGNTLRADAADGSAGAIATKVTTFSWESTPVNPDPDPEPNPGDETLPELPSSTGTNEVGGKTYQRGYNQRVYGRWEFSANGTYRFSWGNDDVWKEMENGAYSWNSSGGYKTLTLAPQRVVIDTSTFGGPTLYDKAGWKAAFRTYAEGSGLADHISEETDGEYTSLTTFINDYADYSFGLRLYNYTMSGETIDTFDSMGIYGYGNAKGGKVIVQNDTSNTLTVKTYSGYAETEATATISAGQSSQVFESSADTFLTKIQITTSGSFTEVDIDSGSIFEGGGRADIDGRVSSYEEEAFCVAGGMTITYTVE